DSLLDVSRIASGQLVLQREPLDLAQVLALLVDSLQGVSARAGCTLTLDAAIPVRGTWDRLRLEQVVTNLIANALKYGAHGPVKVSLATEDRAAVIEVSDRGPGIPEDALDRIFSRF